MKITVKGIGGRLGKCCWDSSTLLFEFLENDIHSALPSPWEHTRGSTLLQNTQGKQVTSLSPSFLCLAKQATPVCAKEHYSVSINANKWCRIKTQTITLCILEEYPPNAHHTWCSVPAPREVPLLQHPSLHPWEAGISLCVGKKFSQESKNSLPKCAPPWRNLKSSSMTEAGGSEQWSWAVLQHLVRMHICKQKVTHWKRHQFH